MNHITQIQNVIRNYDAILNKKKTEPVQKLPSEQNEKFDRISISKEAIEKMQALKDTTQTGRETDKNLV